MKPSRQVSRNWSSTVEVSSNRESDSRTEARSIHQVLRSYQGGRSFLDCSTRYGGGVEITLRKRLQKLDRQQGIEEVSSQLFKIVFRKEKNTDMNAIQHTTQPKIQSTQKNLSKQSLNLKIFEHKDLQNTNTLNKSNQFYISKISQDSLVSIH